MNNHTLVATWVVGLELEDLGGRGDRGDQGKSERQWRQDIELYVGLTVVVVKFEEGCRLDDEKERLSKLKEATTSARRLKGGVRFV